MTPEERAVKFFEVFPEFLEHLEKWKLIAMRTTLTDAIRAAAEDAVREALDPVHDLAVRYRVPTIDDGFEIPSTAEILGRIVRVAVAETGARMMEQCEREHAPKTIEAIKAAVAEARAEERELWLLLMKHHDVGATHASCGDDSIARAWGKTCPVCAAIDAAATAKEKS